MSGLLRVCTAGSVDDGKSTLIGRLLHDSRSVYEDQISSVEKASKNRNAGPIDFSLFTDGLKAEREQGITIDVAYRYFATARRKFILADTPGHEQYTRNMATGASTADLAILLVDARNGVRVQSKRHARIARLLGINHFVLAINKMDLVGFDRAVFDGICDDFEELLRGAILHPIPTARPGSRDRACCRTSKPWRSPRTRRRNRSGSRFNWCPGPTRTSAAMPGRSCRERCGAETRSRSGRRRARRPSNGSSPGTGIWTWRSPRCR
jgi:small GTP-binding protein